VIRKISAKIQVPRTRFFNARSLRSLEDAEEIRPCGAFDGSRITDHGCFVTVFLSRFLCHGFLLELQGRQEPLLERRGAGERERLDGGLQGRQVRGALRVGEISAQAVEDAVGHEKKFI